MYIRCPRGPQTIQSSIMDKRCTAGELMRLSSRTSLYKTARVVGDQTDNVVLSYIEFYEIAGGDTDLCIALSHVESFNGPAHVYVLTPTRAAWRRPEPHRRVRRM